MECLALLRSHVVESQQRHSRVSLLVNSRPFGVQIYSFLPQPRRAFGELLVEAGTRARSSLVLVLK